MAWKKYAHGHPLLRWHWFIKSTPPEGLAAPLPWWWCLLCVCVVCCGLVYSSSLIVCRQVPRDNPKVGLWVLHCGPPRLAPYLMTSFSLHKRTWIPISEANLADGLIKVCTHMALRQHRPMAQKTLYMVNMDVWSGLRWISASTINHDAMASFHSTSEPEFPNLGPT